MAASSSPSAVCEPARAPSAAPREYAAKPAAPPAAVPATRSAPVCAHLARSGELMTMQVIAAHLQAAATSSANSTAIPGVRCCCRCCCWFKGEF